MPIYTYYENIRFVFVGETSSWAHFKNICVMIKLLDYYIALKFSFTYYWPLNSLNDHISFLRDINKKYWLTKPRYGICANLP